jgi:hypothetical protein
VVILDPPSAQFAPLASATATAFAPSVPLQTYDVVLAPAPTLVSTFFPPFAQLAPAVSSATTTVAEMMITSDTFRTRVQGIIYGAVLESITPIGDDTYETTMSLDGRVVNDLRVLYLAQMAAARRR